MTSFQNTRNKKESGYNQRALASAPEHSGTELVLVTGSRCIIYGAASYKTYNR